MTASENSNDETTSVSLTITGVDLPEADERRKALLADLEKTLTTLLTTDFDQPTVDVEARGGHWYATVAPTCPDCGTALDIRDVHLGDDEDAFAVARCSTACGWMGDAVFKLIDLGESAEADFESSVLAERKTPDYHSYRDRNP